MKQLLTIAILFCIVTSVAAQKKSSHKKAKKTTQQKQTAAKASDDNKPLGDTTQPSRTVIVTSAFQPTLKASSKVNFSASAPLPDTARPSLNYDVPSQNLFFAYQSAPLKPLAINIDTILPWQNKSFIKAGYGNYTTPFLQAGLSFGDGTHSIVNLNGTYTSSNSSPVPFQQYSKVNVNGIGVFTDKSNRNEWTANVFFDNNTQYEYGFQPDTLKYTKDELKQSFTTFGGKVALRNKTVNSYGLDYNPSIEIVQFADNHSANETNFALDVPVSKSITKVLAFNLGLSGNLTNYKSDSASIKNNLYTLSPAIQFKTPDIKIIAGITPSWDNAVFSMLPNFSVEAKIKDQRLALVAGWVGYFNKTSYRSLAAINPWLQQPTFLLNTREKEIYAGFKGSAGNNITYNAKVSYIDFSNQPLFTNDTITGKSFMILNESGMKDLRIHGELGYTLQEKISLLAGVTYNQYTNLKSNDKPWGLTPLELTGTLRWQIMKDLFFKSDVFFWDGTQYRGKDMQAYKLDPAADVNAGFEFAVAPRWNVWLQLNNIFNNKYERWCQYPVYGFNVLAGVVYSFGELKK
jgi:hypothetical protein